MKELLGLVGFGPEGETTDQETAEQPVERTAPAAQPVVERVERPAAAARPAEPVEQPKAAWTAEPPKAERPKAEQREEPVQERPVEKPRGPFGWGSGRAAEPAEEPKAKTVPAPERTGFFSFGEPKTPTFGGGQTPKATPVEEPAFRSEDEEPVRPPFIRPGATVIAAGATFFGDIRAEGDVEVLGKLKGNLEATGNVRVTGKVLGDVKGEAVVLTGATVQGNVTSTTTAKLDEGATVVGDMLAVDVECAGKIKGTLQIARAATFFATAILAGNVTAGTIVMSQGARIQGAVRIAEDPETSSLFGEGLEI